MRQIPNEDDVSLLLASMAVVRRFDLLILDRVDGAVAGDAVA